MGFRRRVMLGLLLPALALLAQSPPVSAAGASPVGSYRNPFRAVHNLYAERIDMGVDYSGSSGPIFPLGPAVIKGTTGQGWGAGGVLYKLTAGPARGKWVYVAECILGVDVHVGQRVNASTRLGRISLSCGTGIEMGWAVVGNQPLIAPMASSCFVQFNNGSVDPTWYGKDMNRLLVALGVPSGHGQHPHTTCSPNPAYPSWR
jgi:hypothetical protein